MKKTKLFSCFLLLGGALIGCSHGHPRGTLVTSLDREQFIAHLGKEDVQPGDAVTLFRAECRDRMHAGGDVSDDHCRRLAVGQAKVVRNLSDDFSIVRVAPGTAVAPGTLVEKAE